MPPMRPETIGPMMGAMRPPRSPAIATGLDFRCRDVESLVVYSLKDLRDFLKEWWLGGGRKVGMWSMMSKHGQQDAKLYMLDTNRTIEMRLS